MFYIDYIPERERINVDKNCFNLPEPPSLSAEAQRKFDIGLLLIHVI